MAKGDNMQEKLGQYIHVSHYYMLMQPKHLSSR